MCGLSSCDVYRHSAQAQRGRSRRLPHQDLAYGQEEAPARAPTVMKDHAKYDDVGPGEAVTEEVQVNDLRGNVKQHKDLWHCPLSGHAVRAAEEG